MRKRPDPRALVALAIASSFLVTACVTTGQKEGESATALEAIKARLKRAPATAPAAAPASKPAAAPASEPAAAPAPAPSPSPPPSNANWTLISDQPFSYFPKGLPKDSLTDHLHGEWVNSGDGSSRWFVPKGGHGGRSEKELQAEALSLRTAADQTQQAQNKTRSGSASSASSFASGLLDRLPKRAAKENNE